jgi:hypothetical protein
MQLEDEDRERRRATGPTTTRPQERGDASVREHGKCKSTRRRGMRWIILTNCSFFLGKPSQTGLGAKPIPIEQHH